MNQYNQLLVRVAEKDTAAFKKLYQLTSPQLYALSLRLLRNNKELAEDTVQEAFIKIWKRAAKFRPEIGSAMTWMGTIIRNQAIDQIRHAQRRPTLVAEQEYETANHTDNSYQLDELQSLYNALKHLNRKLADLPERHRECLIQSFYYGYSHREISENMSVPLGTIKAWIRRSLEKIRQSNDCALGTCEKLKANL